MKMRRYNVYCTIDERLPELSVLSLLHIIDDPTVMLERVSLLDHHHEVRLH